jgi:lipopolysaccharide/colanic/teichoic acid biosynthesis glycosyltransferase
VTDRDVTAAAYEAQKRLFDLTVAGIGLLATLPLWPVIALAVWVDSPGPVIFRQERVGRNDTRFCLLKFRSMWAGTPSLSTAQLAQMHGGSAVTRVGRFLRRSSLDELPQLVNVLRGEMSLVGPRPALPSQTVLLELRRIGGADVLLPGITGWAQINGRDNLNDTAKAAYDADYLKRRSLRFDLTILGRTIAPVLTGRGNR